MVDPLITDLAVQLLYVAGIIVRLWFSALAIFFVMSAIAAPIANRWPHRALTTLRDTAGFLVLPVRRMLNREVADGPFDPSPLVAALISVILGQGIESFLGLIAGMIAG